MRTNVNALHLPTFCDPKFIYNNNKKCNSEAKIFSLNRTAKAGNKLRHVGDLTKIVINLNLEKKVPVEVLTQMFIEFSTLHKYWNKLKLLPTKLNYYLFSCKIYV